MQRQRQMTKHQTKDDNAAAYIQARVRGRAARKRTKIPKGSAALAWAAKEIIADKKEEIKVATDDGDVIDRDRLCCDILNTSVMAALVGGFALGNMVLGSDGHTLDNIIYLLV